MLLGEHVAELDLLRELDFLRCGQEGVTAGFAQEELQRVGRGLLRRGQDRRGCGLLRLYLVDDLDATPVELAVERVLLQRVELVCLDDLGQSRRLQRPGLLGRVQQLLELVVKE